MTSITADFVQGDTLSKVTVAVVDENDDPVDLTLAEVILRYRIRRRPAMTPSALQTKTMTVVSAVGGTAEYQFATGELQPGELACEARATLASGKVITTKAESRFTVRGLV